MLAWSEELITDDENQKSLGYDVIVAGGELLLITPSPSQTCHAKTKLKSGAGRYQLLSRWWDAHRRQRPERLLSEKSGRWHCHGMCSRLRRGAYL